MAMYYTVLVLSFIDCYQAFLAKYEIQEYHCISGDPSTPTTPIAPAAAEQNAEGGILNRLSKMLGYADQADNSSAASTPTDGTYKPVGDDTAGKYLTILIQTRHSIILTDFCILLLPIS